MTNKKDNTKPIRTLHVIGYMDRGGAETFLMNVLRNIDRDKCQFVFLCFTEREFDYEREVNELGSKIVRIPGIKRGGLIRNIFRMVKIMRSEHIDIVHTHIFYDSVFSLFAAFLARIKVRINHSHSTKPEQFPPIRKQVYYFVCQKLCNLLVTERIACTKDAGAALFGRSSKFQLVYNGIRITDFNYSSDARRAIRSEYGIEDAATVLMHVGRFDKEKNHKFIVEVFRQYIEKDATAKLLLIGAGPLEAEVHDLVRDAALEENVIFLGKRSDVWRYYSAADLFLLPSLYEGLGIVLVEAQSNGLRSLVSDGVPVEANLTGLVSYLPLECGPREWADSVTELIAMGRPETIPLNGAIAAYNIDTVVDKLTAIYRQKMGR